MLVSPMKAQGVRSIHEFGEEQAVEVVRLSAIRSSENCLKPEIDSETTSLDVNHGYLPRTNPFS